MSARETGCGNLAADRWVEHVDRSVAFRGDEHEVDLEAVPRHQPTDPVEEPGRVLRDELDDGVGRGLFVVDVHERCDAHRRPATQSFPFPSRSSRAAMSPRPASDLLQQRLEALLAIHVAVPVGLTVDEMEDVQDQAAAAGHLALLAQRVHSCRRPARP